MYGFHSNHGTVSRTNHKHHWTMMKTNSKTSQKMMEVHEDWLTGEEKGTNPVYSPSQLTSPHGPPLLAPRWGAKLFRLRRKSSIRPSAPWSLVALGGGREEKRAGRRRTGQVGAPLFFKTSSVQLPWLSLTCFVQKSLERGHSLWENHHLFNTFYYFENG